MNGIELMNAGEWHHCNDEEVNALSYKDSAKTMTLDELSKSSDLLHSAPPLISGSTSRYSR